MLLTVLNSIPIHHKYFHYFLINWAICILLVEFLCIRRLKAVEKKERDAKK